MSVPQPAAVMVRAQKETGVGYLLWIFLGAFGAHRFYLGRNGSAIAQVALNVVGWLTVFIIVGFVFLAVLWVWLIVDAFLIPSMTREANHVTYAPVQSSPPPPPAYQ